MITILKNGDKNKLKNITYVTTCDECDCTFTYQQEDLHWYNIDYDEIGTTVQCPCCWHQLTIEEKEEYKGDII